MNRLILVGSPRVDGRCASLADEIFEACIEDFPQDEVALAPVSTLDIAGCTGCNACAGLLDSWVATDGSAPEGEASSAARCSIDDDMADLYPLIDAADELSIVTPVYFAGVPSQFKALLDRLQPYYQRFAASGRAQGPKRPCTIHVVGEGGDPHGFEPAIGTIRSAISCAGFAPTTLMNWVGCIEEDGTITAEAKQTDLTAGSDNQAVEPQANPQTERPKEPGEQKPVSSPKKKAVLHVEDKQLNTAPPANKRQGGGKNARSAQKGGGRPTGGNRSGKQGGKQQRPKKKA